MLCLEQYRTQGARPLFLLAIRSIPDATRTKIQVYSRYAHISTCIGWKKERAFTCYIFRSSVNKIEIDRSRFNITATVTQLRFCLHTFIYFDAHVNIRMCLLFSPSVFAKQVKASHVFCGCCIMHKYYMYFTQLIHHFIKFRTATHNNEAAFCKRAPSSISARINSCGIQWYCLVLLAPSEWNFYCAFDESEIKAILISELGFVHTRK